MINKILGTAGTRVLNAIFNTVILIVLTRELGSTGFGIISLIILAITILQLVIDLVAGSGIIYFTTRKPIIQLLVPAYIWILMVLLLYLIVTLIAPGYFPKTYYWIVPKDFEFHIFFLTLLNALMLTNYNLLIGLTRIKTYNTIFVIQSSVLIVSVLVMYFILDEKSVLSFVYSMYFGYGTGMILSLISVSSHLKSGSLNGWVTTAKAVIGYGFTSQLANVLHIGNKRFSFYILKYFSGVSAVGIYSAGAQLTEGLRLIGQSISLVQFSSIASQDSQEYSRQLTIRLMKLSLTVTLFALILLLVVPSSFYTIIFKKDFSDLKLIIAALSPGVLALAANTIFSGYFSGVGQPKISLIVNAIGFVVTLISAWLLIPLLGYTGAALAASLSYASSVVGQYLIFQHQTGTKFHEWIPDKSDYLFFVSMVHRFTKIN